MFRFIADANTYKGATMKQAGSLHKKLADRLAPSLIVLYIVECDGTQDIASMPAGIDKSAMK